MGEVRHDSHKPEPNRLIEPDSTAKNSAKVELDYSLWEHGYGRTLTEVEKIEIRENLLALSEILLSEHDKELKANGGVSENK